MNSKKAKELRSVIKKQFEVKDKWNKFIDDTTQYLVLRANTLKHRQFKLVADCPKSIYRQLKKASV